MGTERQLGEMLRVDGDSADNLLPPQVLAAGVTTTLTVRLRGFKRAAFLIQGGAANDANATLDAVVHQCTQEDDGGGDAKVLAGAYGSKAITQVTAGAGFATLNQMWLINIIDEELDIAGGFEHVLLSITVSAADTWALCVNAIRGVAGYEPVDTSGLVEVVG